MGHALKLLAISWAMPPYVFPRSIQVGRTLKGLHAQGIRSRVICARIAPADFGIAVDARLERLYAPPEEPLRLPYDPTGPGGVGAADDAWVAAGAEAGGDILDGGGIDALVTFAQPWIDHLAGLRLRERHRIPWVAHFSDPWVDNPYSAAIPQALRRRWEEQEHAIIGTADAVVFTNEETRDLVMRKYPSSWENRTAVVPHSFDPDALDAPEPPSSGPLRIAHIGDFYPGRRTPRALFEALATLGPEERNGVEIVLAGRVPEEVGAMAAALGIADRVRCHGVVGHEAALRIADDAHVLVVIDAPAEVNVFLPSKLFDYMPRSRPIIGFTPANGATAAVLHRLGCPVLDPLNGVVTVPVLEALLADHRAGRLTPPPGFSAAIDGYHYLRTSAAFAAVLHRAIG